MSSNPKPSMFSTSKTPLFSGRTSEPSNFLEKYRTISGKKSLVNPTEEESKLWENRLNELLMDGNGDLLLEVGVGDVPGIEDPGLSTNEYECSISNLKAIASQINAHCIELNRRKVDEGFAGHCLIRKLLSEQDFIEIRIAVVGNVDAGKSTLLGVLTHGELDNGRGQARQKLFRHKHEMESGRTSSVGNDILGFDVEGNIVNKADHGSLDWVKICERSTKVITFIDLAGHERYLKTTVFGMTGHAPDFGMLMIGANAGIVGMTKEHLGLALALNVPVFVVVTKIDMCPPNVLEETLKMLNRILRSQGCRKVPIMIKSVDDVVMGAKNMLCERLCPIFLVSSVTGENLHFLKTFLNLLSTRVSFNNEDPAEFQIDDIYTVPGVGVVVSGITLKGVVRVNDTLLLGPDPVGHFISTSIRSIHRKRMLVKEVRGGQTASFALKKVKRSQIRKGMVMVSPSLKPIASLEFEADILVLHHPTTINPRYQAMVHCGSIRQTAYILKMSSRSLRTGERATVHFRFIKYPEYLKVGQRLVFREGRTKAVGNVLKMIPCNEQLGVIASHKAQKANKILASLQPQLSSEELPKPAENESTNQENFEGFSSVTNDMKRLNTNSKYNKKHSRGNQGKN
ncbi:GTP-binding protein 1 [Planococcus citri]|uniref:GTP-binding protein 1 n=1 Tax=Planococcus citri TaxID=170843 RepID=UPI0031F8D019